jgi:GH25 family lysozyme M1 (1,4-beta-N-acetylmuramidase)
MGTNSEAQVDHAISSLMGQELELGFYLDWEPGECPVWELPSTYGMFLDKAMTTRNPTGTYCDQSWYALLRTANMPIYRLWLADYNITPVDNPFVWQHSEVGTVDGIPAAVDLDYLESTRGLNIHTGPLAKPTAATVHSVKDAVTAATAASDDPAFDALAEHTPPPDAMRSGPTDEPASE